MPFSGSNIPVDYMKWLLNKSKIQTSTETEITLRTCWCDMQNRCNLIRQTDCSYFGSNRTVFGRNSLHQLFCFAC